MFTRLFKKFLQNKEHQPAERAESFRPIQNYTVQEQIDGAASGHDIYFHWGGQVPRVLQDKSRVYGNVSGVGNNEHPGFFWYPQEVVDTESDEFWVGGIALGNEQCCETYTLRTYDRHCSREFICRPC